MLPSFCINQLACNSLESDGWQETVHTVEGRIDIPAAVSRISDHKRNVLVYREANTDQRVAQMGNIHRVQVAY